jgi:transcriptional regulator with XRE-family HTH domain
VSRRPLTDAQKEEGRRLAESLRSARERQDKPQSDLAKAAGVSLDMLRKMERAYIATPSFFIVARLARELDLRLDALADDALGT